MKRFGFIVIILLSLWTGILFRKYLVSGQVPFPGNLQVSFYQPWASYPKEGYAIAPPSKPLGFDNLRIFYPSRKLVTDSLKAMRMPLWNPYSFSGNVLLGAYQSAVFFPLGFLFFLLPAIDAWSIIIMLAPVLTGWCTYLFARSLGMGKRASLFAGITYAFSGMMIVWWQEMFMAVYSMLVLPLVLLAVTRLTDTPKAGWYAVLVGSLAASVLAGWFQATFYVFAFAFVWLAYRMAETRKPGRVLLVLSGFVLALAVTGIQLAPGFEAYRNSARGAVDAGKMFADFFAPVNHIVTLLAPDFFGNPAVHNYYGTSFYHEKSIWIGIPALVFVLMEILYWKSLSRREKFFAVCGVAVLSLAFDLPTSWFLLYRLHLPFVSEMTPSRIIFLSSFLFAVVSGYGVERYLTAPSRKMLLSVAVLAAAFAVSWWYAYRLLPSTDMHYRIALRNMVVPSVLFAATAAVYSVGIFERRLRGVPYLGLLVVAFASVLYFSDKYLYFSERRFVFPQVPVLRELETVSGIDRFWSVGRAHIFRNFSNYYRLFSPEGYESFNIDRYSELVFASHRKGKLDSQVPRADAQLYWAETAVELKDPYRKRIMDITGVKYVVVPKDEEATASAQGFAPVWSDGHFSVTRNPDAVPRVFLAGSYVVETDRQKILDRIYGTDDLGKTVILESKPDLPEGPLSTGSATLVSYAPETVTVRTVTGGPSLLFLSDNFYPGWVAEVDGIKAPIYRADYSFRAVPVPEGNHVVVFSYSPDSLKFGGLVSVGGILALGAVCFALHGRKTA